MNTLLRARWSIVACGVLVGLLVGVRSLVSKPHYTSRAVIVPQGTKSPSMFAGLASQLNLNLPGGDASQSPAFYADLVQSRELLGATVDSRYDYVTAGQSRKASLVDIYGIRGMPAPLAREYAIDSLAASITVEVVAKTGVIRISSTASTPELAQQISQRLIDLLDQFNRQRRKGQAASERQFVEQRLSETTIEVRRAEDRLQAFLQENRSCCTSPELTFERDRLNNDLSLRRDLNASIAKAYEDARLEEVRDTPVITIIEAPPIPVRPDRRGTVRKAVYGFGAGLAIGVLLALARAFVKPRPEDAKPLDELERLRREALNDLLRPWTIVARLMRRQ